MKFWEIEEKILLWIGLPAVLIGSGILIYNQGWAHVRAWFWEMGSMLLYLALTIGFFFMLVGSLLYLGERKKTERLEQEVQRLKNKLGED
jgi:hypothetical protein